MTVNIPMFLYYHNYIEFILQFTQDTLIYLQNEVQFLPVQTRAK